MVIRGPHGGARVPEPQPGLKKDQPTSPLQRLVEFGAARTPQEAKRVITELLASLRAAGFPVPATGSPESKLKTALESFQRSERLPPGGQLDKDTLDRLSDAGHLPQKGDASGVDVPQGVRAPAQDKSLTEVDKLARFLGGELGLPTGGEAPADSKSPRKTEVDEKAHAAKQEKAPPLDMKNFVSSLRAAGFAGAGRGAEQLKDAIKRLQNKEGLPVTGRIDPQTADALVKRGVLTEAQARDLVPTTSQAELKQPPDAAQERARTANDSATQDPTTRGVPERGDPNAQVGRDGADGHAQRAGDGGQGASKSVGEGHGGVDDGEMLEGELSPGNAPSGDDRVDDERRGHASIDDDREHAEGHYEVPSLRDQIERGLAALARDDRGRGAATYAWDFTLYKPGIYGAKQSAERLFHVVVSNASAFDALWERARDAINEKLATYEPDAAVVTFDDLQSALRRARVR